MIKKSRKKLRGRVNKVLKPFVIPFLRWTPSACAGGVEAIRDCKWEAATHETKEIVIFNFHRN